MSFIKVSICVCDSCGEESEPAFSDNKTLFALLHEQGWREDRQITRRHICPACQHKGHHQS